MCVCVCVCVCARARCVSGVCVCVCTCTVCSGGQAEHRSRVYRVYLVFIGCRV